MNWLFIIVTLLPFLGYGIDGYNEKNIPKAIYTLDYFSLWLQLQCLVLCFSDCILFLSFHFY